jgi:hypothetical protein
LQLIILNLYTQMKFKNCFCVVPASQLFYSENLGANIEELRSWEKNRTLLVIFLTEINF